jgi:hypothetical protein
MSPVLTGSHRARWTNAGPLKSPDGEAVLAEPAHPDRSALDPQEGSRCAALPRFGLAIGHGAGSLTQRSSEDARTGVQKRAAGPLLRLARDGQGSKRGGAQRGAGHQCGRWTWD